jgi:nucleosome assembly protein 1-like 1
VPEEVDAEAEDNDEIRMLAADFEIGHMLRDSIVPKAVLYFTGEAGDEEDGDVRKNILLKENYKISILV